MHILIFYKNENALEHYIDRLNIVDPRTPAYRYTDRRGYRDYNTIITCLRGLPREYARVYRAHIIAVEQELTWEQQWERLRDVILDPIRCTPLPIQIFDSVTYDEAEANEQQKAGIQTPSHV